MRLFLLFISLNIFGQNVECPGYVFDKPIDNFKFTGQCSEEDLPVWGVANYEDGASFQGFFGSDGKFSKGILTYPSGNYFIGKFNTPGDVLGQEYIAFGTCVMADGDYTEAYFDENLDAIGFGVFHYKDGYTMGMVAQDQSSGIGVLRSEDSAYNLYGTFVNNSINGISFMEYDDGSNWQQYFINNEGVGEKKAIDESSFEQLNEIKEFLSLNYAQLMSDIGELDSDLEEYYKLVEAADAQIEATTKRSKFASKRSLIVKSAQELLSVLGYMPGRADGILGPLTNAAITAFKEDQNLPTELSIDENLLVELQKQVRKESNAEAANSATLEPMLSGTGTGFFVTENTLVTNQHVIEGCAYVSDSQNNKLDIIAVDRLNDLAILKSQEPNDNFIYLSEDPVLGQTVYVAGFPYNFETLNFTTGAVSALVGPEKNITQFQLTAPIQPGNSGGPILNTWGSLVGVTFARIDDVSVLEQSGTIPQNINYGIKHDVVRDMLEEYNIPYSSGRAYWFQPSQEVVAELSRETTILLNCYSN